MHVGDSSTVVLTGTEYTDEGDYSCLFLYLCAWIDTGTGFLCLAVVYLYIFYML